MGKKHDKSKHILEKDSANEISAFLFNLGNQFVRVGNAEAGFDCFKYSLDLRPEQQPAVYNLACLYNITGDRESAYRMFKEAVRMDSSHVVSKVALAEVSRKLGKLEEASSILNEVLAKYPDDLPAASAQSILYYDLGRLAEAAEWNDKAIGLNPSDLHLLLNKALINMTYGHWAEWWAVYEQCLSYGKHNSRMKHLNREDSWQGDPRPGRTLLIVSDQGAGDAIQFGRFIKDVKERGQFKCIKYLVQVDVKPIVAAMPGVDEVYGFSEVEKIERDDFASLLGIMRALRVTKENCRKPADVSPDPALAEIWEHRINAMWDGSSAKVGIVWGGDPLHGNDANRSIPLPKLLPSLNVPGIQLFSFQVGNAADQAAGLDQINDVGSMFRDYSDTAAALSKMDLLITVDTSILHLAGTMGVPTWGLIANPPEWRWGLIGNDSLWYDSVELFRQAIPRDWTNVLGEIKTRLIGLVDGRKASARV